jgi:hypothetical protein
VHAPLPWWRGPLVAGAVVALAAVALLPGLHAADKGKKPVEKTEYVGWKNNLRLNTGAAELIVTLDVGPRVISYRLDGGKNVFKEYADQLGKSGEKVWQIRGGHRLWVGPEDLTRTYALDNAPVQFEELPQKEAGVTTVRLTPPPDAEYGIQKSMDITVTEGKTQVTVVHHLKNVGDKPADLAAWVLTVMAPGGVEVIPLPPKHPHPGPPKNARSPAEYAPDQTMVLWPFFDFKDPRWSFGSKYITLRQDPKRGPTKIGLAHRLGWVGYLNGGTLFVKRFDYQEGKPYPDNGVNFETFSNEDMLEIESLGPLVKLAPGAEVTHTERWDLFGKVEDFKDEVGIDNNILQQLRTR